MELNETRKKIDAVDREILALLNRRMELSLDTGRLKGEIQFSEIMADACERMVEALEK